MMWLGLLDVVGAKRCFGIDTIGFFHVLLRCYFQYVTFEWGHGNLELSSQIERGHLRGEQVRLSSTLYQGRPKLEISAPVTAALSPRPQNRERKGDKTIVSI